MFKQYDRIQKAELRPVTKEEGHFEAEEFSDIYKISVSNEDAKAGSPKAGDMVARNPKNHDDQWLVAKQYFEDNFEEVK